MSYADEVYKQITGMNPPPLWAERTPEERLRARDAFIAAVNESDDDDAVDELFARAKLAFTSIPEADAESA